MRIGGSKRSFIGLDFGARTLGAVQLARAAGGGWRLEAATALARQAKADGGAGSAAVTGQELAEVVGVLDRQGFVGNRVVIAAPESMKFSATLELPPRASGAPIEELARQELARVAKRDAGAIEVQGWDVPAPGRAVSGGATSGPGGAGEVTHLLAVGLAHQDADALIDAVEGSGLWVEAVECRCCAMARACAGIVGGVGGGLGGVSAILDLSESCASIAVMHSGVVAYDRPVMEVGLWRLREQLREELKGGAEAVDYVLEVMGGAAPVGGQEHSGLAELPEHSVVAARKVIDEYLGMVVQELRSVMAYAIHRYPGSIGPVLLIGPGVGLAGGVAGLRERIGTELDLDSQVVLPRDILAGGIAAGLEAAGADASLTLAMGMAMRSAVSAMKRRAS